MENSGFNLMAGFIAATVIVMGVVMYTSGNIYNSASSSIVSSQDSISNIEKDAFNNQFTAYEGSQSGNMVKAMIRVLIANSNTYQDELAKLPALKIADKINSAGDEVEDAKVESLEEINDYVSNLEKISEKLETKHTYMIEVNYEEGIINEITIYYEEQ